MTSFRTILGRLSFVVWYKSRFKCIQRSWRAYTIQGYYRSTSEVYPCDVSDLSYSVSEKKCTTAFNNNFENSFVHLFLRVAADCIICEFYLSLDSNIINNIRFFFIIRPCGCIQDFVKKYRCSLQSKCSLRPSSYSMYSTAWRYQCTK